MIRAQTESLDANKNQLLAGKQKETILTQAAREANRNNFDAGGLALEGSGLETCTEAQRSALDVGGLALESPGPKTIPGG